MHILILCVLALHVMAVPNVISFGSNTGGVAARNTTSSAVDVDYIQSLGGQLENETVVSIAVGSAAFVLGMSGKLFVAVCFYLLLTLNRDQTHTDNLDSIAP